MGNFETFLNESVKHKKALGWTNSFEGTAVYLWPLYLNENNEEIKSYKKVLSYISFDIGYSEKDSELLGNNMHEIWNSWKNEFEIEEETKSKAIKWLEEIIENRVLAILEGKYRESYHKAAVLVTSYGEMISLQKLGSKEEYIKRYINKYPRRTAFKAELSKLV